MKKTSNEQKTYKYTLTDKLEGAQTGATQWQDQGYHKDLKAEVTKEKQALYAKNFTYEKDLKNNNGKPICHTKTGKPKSFLQVLNCKLLAKGMETVANDQQKQQRYLQQLIETGYLFQSKPKETNENYLKHLTKTLQGTLKTTALGTELTINPFTASYEEILSYNFKPGPKKTDVGKNTRSYTAAETQFYKKNWQQSEKFLRLKTVN